MRYTPAGVPIVEIVLRHASVQMDGKKPRAVEMEVEALGFGEIAQHLSEVPEGEAIELKGFLAPRSKQSLKLVLHINELVSTNL